MVGIVYAPSISTAGRPAEPAMSKEIGRPGFPSVGRLGMMAGRVWVRGSVVGPIIGSETAPRGSVVRVPSSVEV